MNSLFQFAFSKRLLIPFCILFVVLSGIANAQEKPPRRHRIRNEKHGRPRQIPFP